MRIVLNATILFVAMIIALTLVACEPPPQDGYFQTLPAGSTGRTEAACADLVHRSAWEPRPQNQSENNTRANVDGVNGYGGMTHQAQTWDRVHGNQVGTTDELIQFYACKWGLSDNLIRAEAVVESNWDMDQVGDQGDCNPDPSSVGIMQIKWCQHPGTHQWAAASTSFNLDYYGAVIRGCYNGWDYVTSQPGNLWGCVDRWFSGGLNPNSQYVGWVKTELEQKDWRDWPDQSGQ